MVSQVDIIYDSRYLTTIDNIRVHNSDRHTQFIDTLVFVHHYILFFIPDTEILKFKYQSSKLFNLFS